MRAKKSLGQNFLTSEKIVDEIISVGEISKNDEILEIGPGKGILTEKLLAKAGKVIAIEKDVELFQNLHKRFGKEIEEKRLILVNQDILDLGDLPEKYKLIANIPYNITGEILKKFLSAKNQPSLMVLMVQKEVAERVVAQDGKESILSISVKIFGTPKKIRVVPASFFKPKPKVDSAILLIKDISKKAFVDFGEENFFKIVKLGFSHKRKTIQNNLKGLLNSVNALKNCSIEPNERAERISLEKWACLSKNL